MCIDGGMGKEDVVHNPMEPYLAIKRMKQCLLQQYGWT